MPSRDQPRSGHMHVHMPLHLGGSALPHSRAYAPRGSLAFETQAFRALLEGGAPYVRSRVRNLSPLDCIMMGAPLDRLGLTLALALTLALTLTQTLTLTPTLTLTLTVLRAAAGLGLGLG